MTNPEARGGAEESQGTRVRARVRDGKETLARSSQVGHAVWQSPGPWLPGEFCVI